MEKDHDTHVHYPQIHLWHSCAAHLLGDGHSSEPCAISHPASHPLRNGAGAPRTHVCAYPEWNGLCPRRHGELERKTARHVFRRPVATDGLRYFVGPRRAHHSLDHGCESWSRRRYFEYLIPAGQPSDIPALVSTHRLLRRRHACISNG